MMRGPHPQTNSMGKATPFADAAACSTLAQLTPFKMVTSTLGRVLTLAVLTCSRRQQHVQCHSTLVLVFPTRASIAHLDAKLLRFARREVGVVLHW